MDRDRRARRLFAHAVRYLEDAGWDRDGQDMGIWRSPDGPLARWYDFGEALVVQLEADGVSMLDVD